MNNSEPGDSVSAAEAAEVADATVAEKVAFGEVLLRAREAKSYSIIEVAKATHLGESVIDAIEQSDLKRLPPPTFVQGYLRTYARYLGLPEKKILDDFNRAVPYKRESQLHPRTTLPTQASSHSPVIRSVSILLMCLVLLALIYGAYDYYVRSVKIIGQEKTNSMTSRSIAFDTGNGEQHSVITQDGELIVIAPTQTNSAELEATSALAQDNPTATTATTAITTAAAVPVIEAPASKPAVIAVDVKTGTDVIELQAFDDSWVEVVDAGSRQLYHNLVKNEQVLRLQGEAPFAVFLGNAPAVELQVNGVEVNMNRYIRTNNVARFSVSSRDGNVVFR